MSLTLSTRRRLAIAFAFCSLATLTLLANHPAAGGPTLLELIKAEAHNQFMDGLVHGGFIVILNALIVCFVFFSRSLESTRVAVVVGFVTFCVGCGALMASMILDGLVIPAIAVRFASVANAEDLSMAKALFVFCSILLRLLMPMGLLFQAAAMLSWSSVIVGRRGWRLTAGGFGLVAGISLLVTIIATPPGLGAHVLLGGIILFPLWYLTLAGLLWSSSDIGS